MTTITHDATTITPTTVLGYQAKRASRNILHRIIGRSDFDVTLQPAELRSGTLHLGFESRSAAWECVATHALAGRFVLVDADVPNVNMTYVVAGAISPALEDETRSLWLVDVDYQEVTA